MGKAFCNARSAPPSFVAYPRLAKNCLNQIKVQDAVPDVAYSPRQLSSSMSQ